MYHTRDTVNDVNSAMLRSYPVDMDTDGCSEKERLLTEYRIAGWKYSAAVMELSHMIGIGSEDDYSRLHHAAELARLRCNEARAHLRNHLDEHHCEMSDLDKAA